MEFLPDHQTLSHFLLDYGSLALFILLALGVVALPVPDETLMVIAGILMRKGELPIIPTLVASYAGCIIGITLSYILGRTLGSRVLHNYGKYAGLTEEKLAKAHAWFESYGKWTLTFGFFVPGVRHLTGFAAGSSDLEYPSFALFAYLGASLWATVFLSLGYFLGTYTYELTAMMEGAVEHLGFLLALAAVAAFILWKKFKG